MSMNWVGPPPPPPPNGLGPDGASPNGHWPDGGVPGNGLPGGDTVVVERAPRDVRRARPFWDRIRILLVLAVIWVALWWSSVSSNPEYAHLGWPGYRDALIQAFNRRWWLEVLFGLELVRQISYLLEEHSVSYHRFCRLVLDRVERSRLHMSDWTRYRIGRAVKWVLVVAVVAVIAGAILHENPVSGLLAVPGKLFAALPEIFQILLILILSVGQIFILFWFLSKGGVDVYFPDDVKTRFSDVWGQDQVLERIRESLLFLENPDAIEAHGGYVPGGILLWGPPGTGKTLMAEAMAGETGKPFVFVDPGAFTNMFLGVGILKVKGLFRKLRKLAVRYGGVIVFFDEADSLGNRGLLAQGGMFGPNRRMVPRDSFGPTSPWEAHCNGGAYLTPHSASLALQDHLRTSLVDADQVEAGSKIVRNAMMMMGGGGGGGGMGTLQALLSEMSGLKKPRGFANRVVRRVLGFQPKPPPKYRILIVMATNMPDSLDEAMLRPGRIDRKYRVGYPSQAGRVRTYQGYFNKVSHTLTDEDIDRLATITPYATGATIKDLVNESLIYAIREGRNTVSWPDVLRAKKLKEVGPPEDVEYVERARHAVAVHEACHAVVAYRTRKAAVIDMATIEKAGNYGGFVSSVRPEDEFNDWKSDKEADIMVSLASLAGERSYFGGDNSSGVSADLENATRVASLMEANWGMGATIASHAVTSQFGVGGGAGGGGTGQRNRPFGHDLLEGSLGARIERKLAELMDRTEALLAQNRREVLAVAHALEAHRTLDGDDITAVIEGRMGSTIDGRPYVSPGFLPLAEQYHELALAAHLAHASIEAPLPTPRDWAPELVAAGANGNGAFPQMIMPYGGAGLWADAPAQGWGAPPANGTGSNGAGPNGAH